MYQCFSYKIQHVCGGKKASHA